MTQVCLICNKTGLALSRNFVNIFNDNNTSNGKPLAELLSEVLEKPVNEGGVHTNRLCRKCQKAVLEYDSLKAKLETIKTDLLSEFKSTLPKHDLDYETFAQQIPKTPVKSPTGNPKKSPLKKIVLPASKLQPVPANYVINVNNLAASLNLGTTKMMLPKITSVSSSSKSPVSNLVQKVTGNSSVLTHTVRTSSPNKTSANVPTPGISSTNVTTKPTELSESETITEVNISELLSKKSESMMSFNVNLLPKDFMSSSVTRDDEVKKEADVNDDDSMDIDNDCELTKVIDNSSESDNEGDEKDNSTENPRREYVLDVNDVTLEPLDATNDDDDDDRDDDEYQHTIVMSSEDASILRVMSGQKFMYDGGEVVLAVPGADDDDDDDANNHDSNDESQIELQVSGDEETANAIIAAARDQGGAFIKVGSGEMYRLKSVISKVKGDKGGQNDEEKTNTVAVWDSNKFKCTLCDIEDGDPLSVCSGDAAFITQHVQAAHDIALYVCQACRLTFVNYSQYCEHIDKHEDESERTNKSKTHECSVCKKKYSSKSQLREHQNTHTGEKPHVCVVCKKAFASKYTHQAHMKTHTERSRPFKCPRCGKAFFTQQNLQQHERTHLGVKTFVCKVCGKAFGTLHNLEVHGVVHSGERPHACPHARCGKAFARRAELRDHARTHTGERPFKCDMCDARFAQRSNLHSHKRATHFDDKRYQCNDCPKKFKRRRLLEYHIKASHTGERPLECEVCHATFVYPEHYKKHLRIHSGERPFVCEVCGKAFNSRDNRNTHRFVHSDKKPYECLVCGAGYMRKQLLYAHMSSAGHLAESIVVNQPRVQKVKSTEAVLDAIKSTDKLDTLFENAEELQLETSDGKSVTGFEITTDADGKIYLTGTGDKKLLLQDAKDSLKLVQDIDDTALLTLQNADGTVKADTSGLLAGPALDQLVVDQSQMASGDGGAGDLLRLVQVQLPGGGSGWLALNN